MVYRRPKAKEFKEIKSYKVFHNSFRFWKNSNFFALIFFFLPVSDFVINTLSFDIVTIALS